MRSAAFAGAFEERNRVEVGSLVEDQKKEVDAEALSFLFGLRVIMQNLANRPDLNEQKGTIIRHTVEEGKVAVRLPNSPVRVIIEESQFRPDVYSYAFEALETKVKTWLAVGQRDWAESLVDTWLNVHHQDVGNLNKAATLILTVFKNVEKSQQLYELALEKEPTNLSVLNNYAILCESLLNDLDKAKELYELILASSPEDVQTMNRLATLLLHDHFKDYERVKNLYQNILNNKPNDPKYVIKLCQILETYFEDSESCQVLYDTCINVHSLHADLLNAAAKFYIHVNNRARARELLNWSFGVTGSEESRRLIDEHFGEEEAPVLEAGGPPEPPEGVLFGGMFGGSSSSEVLNDDEESSS